jgi:hypothetical protein
VQEKLCYLHLGLMRLHIVVHLEKLFELIVVELIE